MSQIKSTKKVVMRPYAWVAALSLVAAIALAASVFGHGEGPPGRVDTGDDLATGLRSGDGTSPWRRMTSKIRAAHLPTPGWKALVHDFAPMRHHSEHMSRAAQHRALSAVGAPPRGLALDHAQLIRTEHGNLWLVAGHGLACAFETRTFALACDVVAAVRQRGLFLGTVLRPALPTPEGRRFLMAGVVPDRVRRVRFRVGAGAPRWVAVRHNAVSVEAPEPIIIQALER